jgi:hypothetical protein
MPDSETSNCSIDSADFLVESGSDGLGRTAPVCVERGPEWLAQLAYDPPAWLSTVIAGVVILTISLAALGYHRHGIDEAVLREMADNVLIAICVLCVGVVASFPELPYWALVAITAGGIGLAKAIQWVVYSALEDDDSEPTPS